MTNCCQRDAHLEIKRSSQETRFTTYRKTAGQWTAWGGREMTDEILQNEEFESRWPRDDDRLFVEGTWAYDASVICDPAERSYRMPMGYKRAGDILIDQARSDVADRPNVIYAALFCYRQSMELFLKVLIEEFWVKPRKLSTNTHDLSVLWDRFMSIVDERGRGDEIGLSAARELVMEMHQADRKADGFRFPTGIDGKPFLFGDTPIDLDNIRAVMQGLQNLFEGIYAAFTHEDEALAEMAAEYADV